MTSGEPGSKGLPTSSLGAELANNRGGAGSTPALEPGASVIVTEVSPFHCLYQDALDFHSQSRQMLNRSVSASSRLARAAFLLYVSSSEALIHQAAAELARPDLARWVADPARPLPVAEVYQLVPAILGHASGDPLLTPWPQFAEVLALRASWSYPSGAANRRAYYRSTPPNSNFEPLQAFQLVPGLGVTPESLLYPKTGLPRDPYALRPHHLDTTRGVLDAAIEALDRRLEGALTRDNRHRREPTRFIHPPAKGR